MKPEEKEKLFGYTELNSREEICAGNIGSWLITYTAGLHGIDDNGAIIITRRVADDSSIPQLTDPDREGYIKVTTDGDVKLNVDFQEKYHIRPNRAAIIISVHDGSLKKGEKIFIDIGGVLGNYPGYRIQSFPENKHRFLTFVDAYGTGEYIKVMSPAFKVIPGPVDKYEVVAPSTVNTDDTFSLFIRAIDSYGNVTGKTKGTVEIINGECFNFEGKELELTEVDNGVVKIENLAIDNAGIYYCKVKAEHNYYYSNPIVCDQGKGDNIFWGDMHGQTESTVGTGTVKEYFQFARDKGLLDFSAWQGNDFQVTSQLWANVKQNASNFNDPGNFLAFPGYEWSGTTPGGGDHNIYYLGDDEPIYRSSHAQIEDESDIETDRYPITELWKSFADREDVMAIPHIGGRHANLDYYNPELISLIEIHSHHGTFEWFAHEALERGLKVGFIAASDDHTGRPGMSFPTNRGAKDFVSFDVRGGLTAVYADRLTRKEVWQELKNRHCYGTTGTRIFLKVSCGQYLMGDEFETTEIPVIDVEAAGTETIQEVRLYRGNECVFTYPALEKSDPDSTRKRIKIEWSGVRVKSRNKKVDWQGRLNIIDGKIIDYRPFAFDRQDEGITRLSNQLLSWNSTTSGDPDGIILDLEVNEQTKLVFHSSVINFEVLAGDIKKEPECFRAGGVNCRVNIATVASNLQKRVEFSYKDEEVGPGDNPYWVKVVQTDGHMAWSSPLFINYLPK